MALFLEEVYPLRLNPKGTQTVLNGGPPCSVMLLPFVMSVFVFRCCGSGC